MDSILLGATPGVAGRAEEGSRIPKSTFQARYGVGIANVLLGYSRKHKVMLLLLLVSSMFQRNCTVAGVVGSITFCFYWHSLYRRTYHPNI